MKYIEIKFRNQRMEYIECEDFIFDDGNRTLIVTYINNPFRDVYNIDAIESIKELNNFPK